MKTQFIAITLAALAVAACSKEKEIGSVPAKEAAADLVYEVAPVCMFRLKHDCVTQTKSITYDVFSEFGLTSIDLTSFVPIELASPSDKIAFPDVPAFDSTIDIATKELGVIRMNKELNNGNKWIGPSGSILYQITPSQKAKIIAWAADKKTITTWMYGSAPQIRSALESGAKCQVVDMNGRTPFMYAVMYNNNVESIAELLKSGVNVNTKKRDGVTPLMLAAQFNPNSAIITQLIKAGADMHARSDRGVTPLMNAVQNSVNTTAVSTLIGAGADVNAVDGHGWTALMIAASQNKDTRFIDELLRAGAIVNAKNGDGIAPLVFASASNPSVDVLMALLKAGASVNATDSRGWTPLMMAAANTTNSQICRALLANGADPSAKSMDGKTALEHAEENPVLLIAQEIRTCLKPK